MKCEVCEQDKQFYQLTYKPTKDMKVHSSLSNLAGEREEEKRHFCSNKCLKEWCEMPDNWK